MFTLLILKPVTLYFIRYKKDLKSIARILRNNSTLGEIILWQQLRAGQLKAYGFKRQKPIGNYIVDFYCSSLNLVIEVDGAYHFEEKQRMLDEERQTTLEKLGMQFLRFHDVEVKKDMDQVLQRINEFISEREKVHNKWRS